jgi:hypothetical protein
MFFLPREKPMRANAIYAGGGVKGAALAGCLRAAEQQGVKFVGHGGTSAGAWSPSWRLWDTPASSSRRSS